MSSSGPVASQHPDGFFVRCLRCLLVTRVLLLLHRGMRTWTGPDGPRHLMHGFAHSFAVLVPQATHFCPVSMHSTSGPCGPIGRRALARLWQPWPVSTFSHRTAEASAHHPAPTQAGVCQQQLCTMPTCWALQHLLDFQEHECSSSVSGELTCRCIHVPTSTSAACAV